MEKCKAALQREQTSFSQSVESLKRQHSADKMAFQDAIQASKTQSQEELLNARASIASLQEQLQQQETSLKVSSQQYEQAKLVFAREKAVSLEKISKLQKQVQKAEKQVCRLSDEKQAEIVKLQSELARMRDQKTSADKQFTASENKWLEQRNQLEAALEQLEESLAIKNQDLNACNTELRSQVDQLENGSQQLLELKKDKQELADKVTHVSSQLKEVLSLHETEVQNLRNALEARKLQVTSKSSDSAKQSALLTAVQSKYAKAKKLLKQMHQNHQTHRKEVNILQGQVQDVRQQLKVKIQQSDSITHEHQILVKRLLSEKTAASHRHKEAVKEVEAVWKLKLEHCNQMHQEVVSKMSSDSRSGAELIEELTQHHAHELKLLESNQESTVLALRSQLQQMAENSRKLEVSLISVEQRYEQVSLQLEEAKQEALVQKQLHSQQCRVLNKKLSQAEAACKENEKYLSHEQVAREKDEIAGTIQRVLRAHEKLRIIIAALESKSSKQEVLYQKYLHDLSAEKADLAMANSELKRMLQCVLSAPESPQQQPPQQLEAVRAGPKSSAGDVETANGSTPIDTSSRSRSSQDHADMPVSDSALKLPEFPPPIEFPSPTLRV